MADHAQEFLFASLDLFALGNVVEQHQRVTSLSIKQRSRHQSRHATPILAEAFLFPWRHRSCSKKDFFVLSQRLAIVSWDQMILGDRPGEQFFFAVANYLREAVIDFMKAPSAVRDGHPEDVG